MTDEIDVHKNTVAISLSREQAIDYGFVQATPEEVAERNERGERFHAEQRALREAFKTWLAAETRGLATVMLDLHSPHDGDYGVTCTGCTADNEHGPQDWPCATVEAIADWARYPLPGDRMPGKRYEEEWTPWDGTPFRLPRPESFVNLSTTGEPAYDLTSDPAFVTLDPHDIG